jgi:hypothetical protein
MCGGEWGSLRPYGAADGVVRAFPGISSRAIFDSSLRDEIGTVRRCNTGGRGIWRDGSAPRGRNHLTDLKHATKIDRIDAALELNLGGLIANRFGLIDARLERDCDWTFNLHDLWILLQTYR